jgi:hypothetical protein
MHRVELVLTLGIDSALGNTRSGGLIEVKWPFFKVIDAQHRGKRQDTCPTKNEPDFTCAMSHRLKD